MARQISKFYPEGVVVGVDVWVGVCVDVEVGVPVDVGVGVEVSVCVVVGVGSEKMFVWLLE